MNTTEFVQAVHLKAVGKASVLVATDTKWIKIVAIANRQIRKWERLNDWNSLYDPRYEVGTVSATDTFELDDEVRKISDTQGDPIRLVDSTDSAVYSDYDIVTADRIKSYASGSYAAQQGRNLVFNASFPADSNLIGRTILLPVYLYADLLTGPNSEVPVDDPEWLITMTAAEYIRNDITKQNQYPNLVAEANEILEKMMEDNDGQINEPLRPWSAGI